MEKAKRAPGAKALRRRAEIVETALSMFAERGYEGASIRDLAGALGINEASIYYYFASKDALYAAVISEHVFRLDVSDDAAPRPLQGWLADLGAGFLTLLTKNRRVTSIVIAEAFKPQERRHPAAAAFHDEVGQRSKALGQRLSAAGRSDADWLAQRFFAGIFGAWALETGFGNVLWSDEKIAAFARRFVDGLLSAERSDLESNADI